MVLPAGAAASFYYHQPWLFVACVLGIFPLIDALIGPERRSSPEHAHVSQGALVPVLFVAGWLMALLLAADNARDAGVAEYIGLTIGGGLLSGMSMAHSHELMHREDRASRVLAEWAIVVAGYPHYRIGHQLHHANVGNPLFGSTARPGQGLWSHLVSSVCATTKACLRHEENRTGSVFFNRMTRNLLGSLALVVAAFGWGGWREALFCLGCFVVCVFVVESIGYLQHYGLSETLDGMPGVIAWDMEYWLSNRMFVSNGRHTDHHTHQARNYGRLVPGGATLPGGYFHMLWAALIPRVWFAVMDQRLAAALAKELPAKPEK